MPSTKPFLLEHYHRGTCLPREEHLCQEEPLELRVEDPSGHEHRVTVTLRSPGADLELAVGFLYAEGFLKHRDEVSHTHGTELSEGQVLHLKLRVPFDASQLQQHFAATASCGLCGRGALAQLARHTDALGPGPTVFPQFLLSLPERLLAAQAQFRLTGGLHAAGYSTTDENAHPDADAVLRYAFEDVGRHNALDKLIGRAFLDDALPLTQGVLLLSGRVGFELVQKALRAGVTVLCAVSAPTDLAVQLAARHGMTLVGFLRRESFNVYSGAHRVLEDPSPESQGTV